MFDFSKSHITLIDSCSYTCYRVGATLSWWSRYRPDDNRTSTELLDDTEFTTALVRQFDNGIKHLSNRCFIRDCPKDDIWRLKHLPSYKSNRTPPASSSSRPMGPLIKFLNSYVVEKTTDYVMRIDNAEADDVIAVLVGYITHCYPESTVSIVTMDSDLHQLISDTVSVYDPKSKLRVQVSNVNPTDLLESKIRKGDPTDKVPSMKIQDNDPYYGRIHNSILVDLDYVPRFIQDRVMLHIKHLAAPQIYKPLSIQLGLCCINTYLREKHSPTVFCSRTVRLDTVHTKGIDHVISKAKQNCMDLITMIKWNIRSSADNGVPVRFMRISSDLLPHVSNHRVELENYKEQILDAVDPILKQAGQLARRYKMRLTFHPGQYNVVGTPAEDKFQNTVRDLSWHAEVLDRMGCDQNSVMVVHGGGLYGNKPDTIQRWITNYSRLPLNVQRRLVLENCEKCFNIVDCLQVSKATGIPVVFDTHHFECYALMHPDESFHSPGHYISDILDTWHQRNIKPKFHVSEQKPGAKTGAHSDFIEHLPLYLTNIPSLYGVDIDIMIEAKRKEQAVRRLYDKYPSLDPEHREQVVTKIKAKMRKL